MEIYSILAKYHRRPECIEAKEKEVENLLNFGIFDKVKDEGQTSIMSRQLLTQKEQHNGQKLKVKVRIVAWGFQETQQMQSDSPTVLKYSLKGIFAIAAKMNCDIVSIDIKGACLQGENLVRNVYIQPPTDIKKIKIYYGN